MALDFEKIFEFITVPLTVGKADYPNVLIYVNQAFCDLTGYKKEELLGKNIGTVLQGPYNKMRETIREKINNRENVDVLVKNYRKDGTHFWNELHIHPVIEGNDCLYFVGTQRDVTEKIESVTNTLETFVTTIRDNFREWRKGLETV